VRSDTNTQKKHNGSHPITVEELVATPSGATNEPREQPGNA
jgi:hypothetical protein